VDIQNKFNLFVWWLYRWQLQCCAYPYYFGNVIHLIILFRISWELKIVICMYEVFINNVNIIFKYISKHKTNKNIIELQHENKTQFYVSIFTCIHLYFVMLHTLGQNLLKLNTMEKNRPFFHCWLMGFMQWYKKYGRSTSYTLNWAF